MQQMVAIRCGGGQVRLAVMRAETSAAVSLAAVALRQLLRCSGCSALRPNGRPGQRYPDFRLLHAQSLQLRSDVVGVLVGLQYAYQSSGRCTLTLM